MFETKTVPTLVGGFGSGARQLGVGLSGELHANCMLIGSGTRQLGLSGELHADCMLIGSGARQLGLRGEQPSLWPFSEREMPLRRRVRAHEAKLARARASVGVAPDDRGAARLERAPGGQGQERERGRLS